MMSLGICSTYWSSPVSTSTLTRMLVPKPKKAFQSPGVQIRARSGPAVVVSAMSCSLSSRRPRGVERGDQAALSLTQPKMPPWASIISRAMRWNSGK